MKNLFLIFIISFSFFSCEKPNLEQVWIGKYCYEAIDGTYSDACPREIFAFGKDSVNFKEFYFQITDGEDNSVYKYPYKIEKKQLIIFKADRIDTMTFQVSKEQFEYTYSNKNKIVYQPLPVYNQAKRKNEFRNYLLNASFEKSDDSLRIEFQADMRFIKDKLDIYFSSNNIWVLDEFHNELFLVFAHDWAKKPTFFHITEFDENGFKGTTYGKENIATTFKKLSKKQVYSPKDFIGKWERYYEPNYEFPVSPPLLPKSHLNYRDWIQKEQLVITDSTLTRFYEFRENKINWSMNREQDILLFSKWRYDSSNDIRQWNILEAKENQFTIKRWNRFDFDLKFEKVTFIKVN